MPDTLCLLVCSTIRPEIDAVVSSAPWSHVEVRTFPSRCGRPGLTSRQVTALTADVTQPAHIEVLGSGCLCDLKPATSHDTHVHRLQQCFEIFAPLPLIEEHLAGGSYLLTPGWLRNWHTHMTEWGFIRSQARAFFKDFAKQLVLLDTGIDTTAAEQLDAFAAFVRRPHITEPVGLDTLRDALQAIVENWRNTD